MKYLFILLIFLLSGCITTKEYKHRVIDPIESTKIRQQLKSKEDIEYFNKIQKNNRNAWIYIK